MIPCNLPILQQADGRVYMYDQHRFENSNPNGDYVMYSTHLLLCGKWTWPELKLDNPQLPLLKHVYVMVAEKEEWKWVCRQAIPTIMEVMCDVVIVTLIICLLLAIVAFHSTLSELLLLPERLLFVLNPSVCIYMYHYETFYWNLCCTSCPWGIYSPYIIIILVMKTWWWKSIVMLMKVVAYSQYQQTPILLCIVLRLLIWWCDNDIMFKWEAWNPYQYVSQSHYVSFKCDVCWKMTQAVEEWPCLYGNIPYLIFSVK